MPIDHVLSSSPSKIRSLTIAAISIYLSFYFYRLGCYVRAQFGTYSMFPTCNLLHALLSVSLNVQKFDSINSSLLNIRDKVLGVSRASDKSFFFLAIAFYKQLPVGAIYYSWWYKNKAVVMPLYITWKNIMYLYKYVCAVHTAVEIN